jgi:hypothetical protein
MLKHVTVDIRRNENTTIRGSYPAWEVPILQVVHGADNVQIIQDKLVNRTPPEAKDEFDRLDQRYRRSRDESGAQSTPYVHMVYGELGVAKLAAAIAAAVTEAPDGDLVGAQVSSVGG